MTTFDELTASRRQWIDDVLVTWCRSACRRELIKAEMDWVNIAGGVDPRATLWTWAWSRFPALTHDGLPGLNETNEVRVTLRSGQTLTGYPDDSLSRRGVLVMLAQNATGKMKHLEPLALDDIATVEFADVSQSAAVVPLPARPLTTMPQLLSLDERV